MSENKLVDSSMELAIHVVNICKDIKRESKESVLTNQLLKSGTSVGANIREANYAQSKADFVAKLQIALKECYESEYWIELLNKTNYISDELTKEIIMKFGSIRRMLIASITTTKRNM